MAFAHIFWLTVLLFLHPSTGKGLPPSRGSVGGQEPSQSNQFDDEGLNMIRQRAAQVVINKDGIERHNQEALDTLNSLTDDHPEDDIMVAYQGAMRGGVDHSILQTQIEQFLETGQLHPEGLEVLENIFGKSFIDTFRANRRTRKHKRSVPDSDITSTRGRHKRGAAVPTIYWEEGIVPYMFDEVDPEDEQARQLIDDVIGYIEDISCVRFYKWYPDIHQDLGLPHRITLNFLNRQTGCWSSVGRTSKEPQNIAACKGSRARHEIFHALGFGHTQVRSDYFTVEQFHRSNVDGGNQGNFDTKDTNNEVPFNIGSFMHVSFTKGSLNGKETVIVYDSDLRFLQDAYEGFIYFLDAQQLNLAYQCQARNCPDFPHVCRNKGYVGFVNGVCKCVCPTGLQGDTCEDKYYPDSPDVWPSGVYALPMSAEGCPDTDFLTGNRKQTVVPNTTTVTGGDLTLPPGAVNVDYFVHHFCSSDNQTSDGPAWPKGSYCIYRRGGSCPTGFTEGSIYFDDAESNNVNYATGTLPDGIFTSDTKFYYCCRRDGHVEDPIKFPRDKPFQLLPGELTDQCQLVEGMRVQSGYYAIATELNLDEYLPPHPYYPVSEKDNNGVTHYYFCHYEPLNYECGGVLNVSSARPSVIITTPDYPSHYGNSMVCQWTVTSPPGTVMSIEFVDFQVRSSEETCEDYVEIRSNTITAPGPRYCGVKFPRTVVSNSDAIMVALHSSSDGTDKGFQARVTLIHEADYDYDPVSKGVTYNGKVNYTQHYQKCMKWDVVKHCPYSIYSHGILLGAHNFCRNPSGATSGPWCYIDTDCHTDICQVSYKIGRCYDKADDCDSLMTSDQSYCQSEAASEMCHETCNLCQEGVTARKGECDPLPTPANAQVVGVQRSSYTEGEVVDFICNGGLSKITRTCLSDGTWGGFDIECSGCPLGFYEVSPGKCFRVFKDKLKHIHAEVACSEHGGTLAILNNPALQAAVVKLLPEYDDGQKYMFGLHDKVVEGEFVWADGKPLSWAHWAPDNYIASKDCVGQLYIPEEGQYMWDDIGCGSAFYYICQVNIGDCPEGYSRINDKCYKLSTLKQKHINAESTCAVDGAILAIASTQEENAAIVSLLPKFNDNLKYMIGLTDKVTEGAFVWSDGNPVGPYTNWADPEYITDKDCVGYKYYDDISGYRWDDLQCGSVFYYICEVDPYVTECADQRSDCQDIVADIPDFCSSEYAYARTWCKAYCDFCTWETFATTPTA